MLTHLSVDPECQKHGIGLRLCQWGLEYAKREELPATLCSTIDGKKLYQKAGFRAVGSWQWAEGNDRTMSIMRWDPPDKKDRCNSSQERHQTRKYSPERGRQG
jgi:predicted N-acetyltransferase YhbS